MYVTLEGTRYSAPTAEVRVTRLGTRAGTLHCQHTLQLAYLGQGRIAGPRDIQQDDTASKHSTDPTLIKTGDAQINKHVFQLVSASTPIQSRVSAPRLFSF